MTSATASATTSDRPSRLGDGHERVVQRRLRHRAEQHRAHRDAELGGREQQAGAVHRLQGHRGALAARVGERLELAAAGRHRGELGTDEEGVGAEQHQRDEHDEPAAHDRSSCSSSSLGSGCGVVALEAHPVDPVAVHVDDPRDPAVGRHGVAHGRHAAQGRHHPAADGLVGRPVGDGDADPGAHLVGAPQPGHGPRPVTQLAAGGLRAVVLVVDLADDLLDEVLEGDHARRAAVLVDDDGELHAALPQLEQQRVEPQRLGHEHRRHHQRRDRHVVAPVERHGDRLLDVHDAVDVVPVVADDREPRVPGAPGQPRPGRPRSRCGRSRSPASAASSRRRRSGRRTRGMP